ncbi:SUKH-3 domain-containing protein [Kitasatospora sp. NPDC091276]|uniref:SUKH-3 domain-containing protein n=1 Tax=Kitasatospora sp. NPDC091276 TaxID=3155300 RepID=UPI003440F5EE
MDSGNISIGHGLAVVALDCRGTWELGNTLGFGLGGLLPEVQNALMQSGWSIDRSVDVAPVVGALREAGYHLGEQVSELYQNLYGLSVQPVDHPGACFMNSDPIQFSAGWGVRHRAEALRLESLYGEDFSPFCRWLSGAHIYISGSGRVYSWFDRLVWEIGADARDAVDFMVLAHRPLVCVHAEPGRAPWPVP